MLSLAKQSLAYIKGIGPKRAELLEKELGLRTALDLVQHYPTSYLDRTRVHPIRTLTEEMPMVQVRGKFISFAVHGEGARARLVGLFSDGDSTMEVIWFRGIQKLRSAYHTNVEYILFGKPGLFRSTRQMVHPEVEVPGATPSQGALRGVYPLTERLRNAGFTSKTLHTIITGALSHMRTISDPMPREVLAGLGLMPLADALRAVHNPADSQQAAEARKRLKFDELFLLQTDILRYARARRESYAGHPFRRVGDFVNRFYRECLPFPLTGAQKRVIHEIHADMASGRQMNRLLQGDVGSGKTLVALLCMLIAMDNGYQACLMAPTEILAAQHHETLRALASRVGVSVGLLTGSTPAGRRAELHSALADGSLHILVGTHALIEENVKFRNLGLAVIDEQHRFGVAQRARLWAKNSTPPHMLVMTATPIPRTLAMTVYGDLDVSVIDEMPPGRKPVQTALRYDTDDDRERLYRGIGRELAKGRQVYIVFPLISENEKLDLQSLEKGYEDICNIFPNYNPTYVHGRMKPAEKDARMELFARGKARILVSTTVIEVGVNVPNATVMVIENAERFGLSQLHQLRGRVGRGADQSYCILVTRPSVSSVTRRRLQVMTSTTDGFVIAEEDMKMRGPGDIEGTMQSGIPFDLKIASLTTDGPLLELARTLARRLLEKDPTLAAHPALCAALAHATQRNADWSRIS